MIKLFLVDDHELFLAGVRSELGEHFEIVGSSGDVDDAVNAIRATQPDVVLIDVHMPGGGGIAVVRNLADTEVFFLALSVSDEPEDVIAMILAGARGTSRSR